MLRDFIKTVCRIAKATDAESNLCRKTGLPKCPNEVDILGKRSNHSQGEAFVVIFTTKRATRVSCDALAVFFGSAGMNFIPQAVSANFNHTFDLFSAWNGRTAPANLVGFRQFGASVEISFSGFLKSKRCFTEHENFIIKKLLITETEAIFNCRRSIYKGFHRNC